MDEYPERREWQPSPAMERELNLWWKWLAVTGAYGMALVSAFVLVHYYVRPLPELSLWLLLTPLIPMIRMFRHAARYAGLYRVDMETRGTRQRSPVASMHYRHPFLSAIVLISAASVLMLLMRML